MIVTTTHTLYTTEDGMRFEELDEAQEHERVLNLTREWFKDFARVPADFDGRFEGYVQQNPEVVKAATYTIQNFLMWRIGAKIGYVADRILDESGLPTDKMIARAVRRLSRIDDKCREWETAYLVLFPYRGVQTCLNPVTTEGE